MLFGIDISDYQRDFDLARAKNEGYEFAFIKATEGATWRGKYFAANLARARAAGMLVAAYHYQRAGNSAQSQVDNIRSMVPTDVPIVIDVEDGGGGVDLTRDIINRLRQAGYRSPLLYLPMWYWQKIGSPSLAGLPPLWYSRYPANRAGYASVVWEKNAGWLNSFWGGYGGLGVEVLQFSDMGRLAGRSPIDLNAYRGTRDQLAGLLNGAPVGNTPNSLISGDDVAQIKDYDPTVDGNGKLYTRAHTFVLPVGRASMVTDRAWLSFKCCNNGPGAEYVRLMSIRGDDHRGLAGGNYPVDKEWKGVPADHTRVYIEAADGQDQFTAYVRSVHPYSLTIEIKPKAA